MQSIIGRLQRLPSGKQIGTRADVEGLEGSAIHTYGVDVRGKHISGYISEWYYSGAVARATDPRYRRGGFVDLYAQPGAALEVFSVTIRAL
jgi:hypothetical protein